jgi:hypothetical protein
MMRPPRGAREPVELRLDVSQPTRLIAVGQPLECAAHVGAYWSLGRLPDASLNAVRESSGGCNDPERVHTRW